MINIKIAHEEYSHNTSQADTDDRWDRPDTQTDHTIGDRFWKSKYGDLFLDKEPELGTIKYVVYVIYSTGDSFGSDAGYGCEFMAIFDTEPEAHELVRKIEISDAKGNKGFTYTDHNGEKIKNAYAPWQGYFESLDYAGYTQVRYAGEINE